MAAALAHLRIVQVDEETGELHEGCPNCEAKENELSELIRKMRGLARELGELRRDKQAEAEDSELWPRAVKHFQRWQRESNHPRCKWTAERFYLIEPFLKHHEDVMIERAIIGHCYDPFTTKRKNGTTRVFNGWDLLFRDDAHFEESANKAPRKQT
jgi:hypothetical protein